jgi:tetratricopeptide (TPR) repeat protein
VLLGQQYYSNPKFQDFLNKNFVLLRADREEKLGDELFKKFKIQATPTILFLDGSGAEVDWILGYDPPADKFQLKMDKVTAGTDTFKALDAVYLKNPKDVPAVFKLALKWNDRYGEDKAKELYHLVLSLDPQGKAGTYKPEGEDFEVGYAEYAEFAIGQMEIYSAKPVPGPMQAFLAHYPASKLLRQAYGILANVYSYQATKEEAAKFFQEYAGKFPDDPAVLDQWLARINRDKDALDKGAELAGKIAGLTKSSPVRRYNKDVAELWLNKGDKDKADEAYGKSFMEGQVSSLIYDLLDYANFWIQKDANKENALAMAEMILRMKPDQTYFLQQTAAIYVKLGKIEKAMEIFGPAWMQKRPDSVNDLSAYSAFWANQGLNLDAALAAAKKAVELKPNQYYLWSTLGNVHLKMKNYDEALKAAQKAMDLADDQIKEYLKKNIERIKNAQAQDQKK